MLPTAVNSWLNQQLNTTKPNITMLAGDASFRKYFRCHNSSTSYILSYETNTDQTKLTYKRLKQFAAIKIPVPKVHAYSPELGVILQEDLGDITLFNIHNSNDFFNYAAKAIDLVNNLINTTSLTLPIFDAEKIHQELQLMPNWLISKSQWNQSQQQAYQAICQQLIDQITSFTPVPIHRDFHSRNLMIHNNKVVSIDIQDAMLGPCLYDLVSLTKDCYIQWPKKIIQQHLITFYQNHTKHFQSWQHCQVSFDFLTIQRHLKAVGIFARLAHRDNKPQFLQNINPTLSQLHHTCKKYQHLKELGLLLPTKINI